MTAALPPVVDAGTWQRELDALRTREKAATRELDAIAAQRRRLPMVKMPDYTLEGEQGPVRLADVFDGKSQLIVYNHMWFPGEKWQCPGCTGFTSQFTRLEFLDDAPAQPALHRRHPGQEARRAGRLTPGARRGRPQPGLRPPPHRPRPPPARLGCVSPRRAQVSGP